MLRMKHTFYLLTLLLLLVSACTTTFKNESEKSSTANAGVSIAVLGTAQDAGAPQSGCKKSCCESKWGNSNSTNLVSSLGLIDAKNSKTYLFDATPDLPNQIKTLSDFNVTSDKSMVDAIFLTHAHIGHYTGLMYMGKEAMDAKQIPTYAMPRMKTFLENNGPWDQLVSRGNIKIKVLQNEHTVRLSENLEVTPFLVPHRDEYSETVGYKILGPNKTALFIPDIDKWGKWEKDVITEINKVDYAFLDATFFSGKEMNNRDISEIPHPFVVESIERFKDLSPLEKNKIIFMHFNHTNPLLNSQSEESKLVLAEGFRIARKDTQFEL